MTKADFVKHVADKAGQSQKDAGKSVDAVIEAITDVLKAGDKVQFVGFGTFEVRERAARSGLNPKTKETIKIPASKSAAFKAGKQLKAVLNG